MVPLDQSVSEAKTVKRIVDEYSMRIFIIATVRT